MDAKLITIAIHSIDKALALKEMLENENINVIIHNVNLAEPTQVSAGVRVRIKESDLTKALNIIEKNNIWEKIKELPEGEKKKILIPIDFSDYSEKACEFGFRLAHIMNAEIMLFHTYFSPIYGSYTFAEIAHEVNDREVLKKVIKKAQEDFDAFKEKIEEKIQKGIIPTVSYDKTICEGIPEEEIFRYSKELKPEVIIMGTRGKNQKDSDLIGSVTAEVIERSLFPVITIPENSTFTNFSSVKKIVYATNFGQKDLIAFEKMVDFLQIFNFKIYFIHIQQKEDVWNEIKLVGIKEYFHKQYPNLEAEYCLIKSDEDILNTLDKFIIDNQIDIIALNTHKRNIFARLLNPSLSKKMIFHSDTPMLIFHG